MRKIIRNIFAVAVVMAGLAAPILATDHVSAQALTEACKDNSSSTLCSGGENGDIGPIIGTVVNTLLFIIGAVAVIMIIIGGIRYTVSGGDSSSVSAAKNTILYAIVGLAVAFFAYAIVNWVLKLF